MARTNQSSMKRMKRSARYLLEVPEGIIRYDGWVEYLDKIQTYVESDWSGCKETRAPTSGGAISWGGGLLKSWARTQGSKALSSGEAEFYAMLKGTAESLGMMSLLANLE